jgi:predicted Rossmann fold nucleotide-binding protein DprA/Smf involved in DNA uptake
MTPVTDSATPVASLFSAPSDAFWACLRLAAAELPPHRLRALLRFAGDDPQKALLVSPDDLTGPDVKLTAKQIARFDKARSAPIPLRLQNAAVSLQVSVVSDRDTAYPANLLPFDDAPPLLFVRGALHPDDKFSIAIVGSRRATGYGHRQAERFARAFAERG